MSFIFLHHHPDLFTYFSCCFVFFFSLYLSSHSSSKHISDELLLFSVFSCFLKILQRFFVFTKLCKLIYSYLSNIDPFLSVHHKVHLNSNIQFQYIELIQYIYYLIFIFPVLTISSNVTSSEKLYLITLLQILSPFSKICLIFLQSIYYCLHCGVHFFVCHLNASQNINFSMKASCLSLYSQHVKQHLGLSNYKIKL